MLSEPKSKQKNATRLHQFVVLNDMLTSHIATLSYYVKPLAEKHASGGFTPYINNTTSRLEDAEKIIAEIPGDTAAQESVPQNNIQNHVRALLETRRNELKQGIIESETRKTLSELKPVADQFNFIANIATDIRKTSAQIMED
jgi:hypothetical protein